MKSEAPARNTFWAVPALILVFGALVIWPAGSHLSWRAGNPSLHGVPAFFLGSFVLVVLAGIVRSLIGCRTRGVRWFLSPEAVRTALIAVAFAATVVALFYNVELWRGKRAFARVARQAEVLGEPLDLQALRPPAIPEKDNFACIAAFAPLPALPETTRDDASSPGWVDLGLLDELAERALDFIHSRSYSHPWMLGEYRELGSGTATTELSRSGAEETLRRLAPVEELLRDAKQGSLLPECQFPWATVNPLFSDRCAMQDKVLIGLQLAFEQRAVAALRTDQVEDAVDDLKAGLRIAAHLYRQSALFYGEPRAHATARLLQPCWEGLRKRCWDAAELTELQGQLESFDPASDLHNRLRFQILTHTDLVESIIPTRPTQAAGLPLSGANQTTMGWIRLIYPKGWSLQNQAALHAFHFDVMKNIISHVGRPTEPERHLVRQLLRGSSDPCFAVFLVPKAVQMIRDNHEFLLFEQTVLNLARTAVALERYRLQEGAYPDQLTALVPGHLAAIPEDPVSAAPLHYGRQADGGFVVYSVGMDGQDDGGTPPSSARSSGPRRSDAGWDWVWLQAPVDL